LGPLTADQIESFQKNPRFIGLKFPEMNKPETLEKRYLGKLSKKALSFMKECLKMDPAQRITASKALLHPYFDGIRDVADLTPPKQDMRIESANVTLSSSNNANMNTKHIATKEGTSATLNTQVNLTSQKNIPQALPIEHG